MSTRGQGAESAGMARCIRPVTVSVFLGAVCCSLALLAFSFLMSVQNIPQSAVEPMAIFALVFGSFVAGFTCAKSMRENGLAYGALCGAVLTLLVILSGLTVTGNRFDLPIVFRIVLIMFAAMLGGVMGVNAKKRRKK